MKLFTPGFNIGILGGGQLARMLALSGHHLGAHIHILSAHSGDPAAQVTSRWAQGDISNPIDVMNFAKSMDIITFESEFVSEDVLAELCNIEERVFPNPHLMGLFQDRLTQKNLLAQYNIPSSPHLEITSLSMLAAQGTAINFPYVLKSRRDGYDGKGTFIAKDEKDPRLKAFFNSCPSGVLGETYVCFKRELAISLARSRQGEVIFFPLVETRQENFKCLFVKGPEGHVALASLQRKLKKMVDDIGHVGLITFELFDLGRELLVNEVAPRVHNSGHYSSDALTEDQFSAHLKAICGIPLIKPKLVVEGGFAMMNLLGDSHRVPQWNCPTEVKLYWYGKKENFPGRKMGHLNATGSSSNRALQKVMRAREGFNL